MTEIDIANDFSRTPAGRTEADHGSNSGEAFRKRLLVPKLKESIRFGSRLTVVLDGTAGYPASFLDEAFGGLIRAEGLDKRVVLNHLEIKAKGSAYEVYKGLCIRYIKEA